MSDYNRATISGRLVRDPELTTPKDKSMCVFNVATSMGYGEHEHTNFIKCTAWGGLADTIKKNFSKGRSILVEGKIKQSRWDEPQEDKTVVKRSAIEIVVDDFTFLNDGKGKAASEPEPNTAK